MTVASIIAKRCPMQLRCPSEMGRGGNQSQSEGDRKATGGRSEGDQLWQSVMQPLAIICPPPPPEKPSSLEIMGDHGRSHGHPRR